MYVMIILTTMIMRILTSKVFVFTLSDPLTFSRLSQEHQLLPTPLCYLRTPLSDSSGKVAQK